MHDPSLCQPNRSRVCFAFRVLSGHGLNVTGLHKQTASSEWLLSGKMSSCDCLQTAHVLAWVAYKYQSCSIHIARPVGKDKMDDGTHVILCLAPASALLLKNS